MINVDNDINTPQHYVIKFVSDLRQAGIFFPTNPASSTNKTDRHDIAEMLMKVALNTINHTPCKHTVMKRMSSYNLYMFQVTSRYRYVVFVFSFCPTCKAVPPMP